MNSPQPASQSAYQVHGKVVEHTTAPRFQAIVHPRDGECITIGEVEWIDEPADLSPAHKDFLLRLALLSWSLADHPRPRPRANDA